MCSLESFFESVSLPALTERVPVLQPTTGRTGVSIKSRSDIRIPYQTPHLRDLHTSAKQLHLPMDYADRPSGRGTDFAAPAGGG